MNRLAAILFFALIAAQVVGLVAFASVREAALRGREVVLQTVPVDPRSLLQGDYAILDYEIAQLPSYLDGLPENITVYVILVEGPEVWVAADYRIDVAPRDGQVYIRGRTDDGGRIDFAIGTYFVPEGTGHIIEQAGDVKVVVALDGAGNAVIKRVLVDGKPFEEQEPAR